MREGGGPSGRGVPRRRVTGGLVQAGECGIGSRLCRQSQIISPGDRRKPLHPSYTVGLDTWLS
jgi:hypothetical protein